MDNRTRLLELNEAANENELIDCWMELSFKLLLLLTSGQDKGLELLVIPEPQLGLGARAQ